MTHDTHPNPPAAASPPPDYETRLLAAARNGDDEAYGELVRRYQGRLRGFAARYIHDSDEIYDLVQEAFIDAYLHLDRFEPDRDFWPWLRSICKNRVLNYLRAKRVRRDVNVRLVDAVLAEQLQADDGVDERLAERLEALKRCLDQLKASQRQLVEQRYAAGARIKDLAVKLDQSAASLAMRLYRIRGRLRECMERRLQSGVA
jgi:RNA polymerase sigma-70 factor, ECF subfamily